MEKANERLAIVKDFNLLEINDSLEDLATQFLKESNLPPHASDDALHISAATVYGVDYLLTWNCKHIANAHIQKKLRQISLKLGYELPTICTPYELIGA